MPGFLVLRLDHRVAPADRSDVAEAIGSILTRPCFADLERVAFTAKHADSGHVGTTAARIVEYLAKEDGDAIVLDSDPGRPLAANARIRTGRHIGGWETRPFLNLRIMVPYDPGQREAYLEAFIELARVLEAAAGYVTVEPTWDLAHDAALSRAPTRDRNPDFSELRARERQGRSSLRKRADVEIAAPEWGMLLGPGHLAALQPTEATWRAFDRVRDVGTGARFVQLTEDPGDAMDLRFDADLAQARIALTPILADVSQVAID